MASGDLLSLLSRSGKVRQLCPNEAPLRATALQPQGLRSAQPGVLHHQQLLLTVPALPIHVLQAPLQNAAVHLYPCPDSQQSRFVTPAPIAQALKHQNPKIIKSPLLAELDIYIESWFMVKMCWNLLLIRVCYLVSTAPLYEKYLYWSCEGIAPDALWIRHDEPQSPKPDLHVSPRSGMGF